MSQAHEQNFDDEMRHMLSTNSAQEGSIGEPAEEADETPAVEPDESISEAAAQPEHEMTREEIDALLTRKGYEGLGEHTVREWMTLLSESGPKFKQDTE